MVEEEKPQTRREHEVGTLAAALLTLDLMKAGGRLEKHQAEGRIVVQTLDGRIRFNTGERSVELAPGQMLTLERGIAHEVEGILDSAFLRTIAWRDSSSIR